MTVKKFFSIKVFTFILISIPLIFGAISTSAKSKKEAKIKFTESTYDFGIIKEKGGAVSHEFIFTNEGNGNLVIEDAKAECGCTTPYYPEQPIEPGKTGKIKVTYNPLHRVGTFNKSVTIKTNGSPSKVRLRIMGKVVP